MQTESKYIREFKAKNPICLTSAGFSWRRVYDCIDLRYGHATRRGAELERAKMARESWAMYVHNQRTVDCPSCGGKSTGEYIDQAGMCAECLGKEMDHR